MKIRGDFGPGVEFIEELIEDLLIREKSDYWSEFYIVL